MNRSVNSNPLRVPGRAGGRSACARAVSLAMIAICLASGSAADRSPFTAEESHLKAAFLFHFVQLVDWPAGALGADTSPLTLCTLGLDTFDDLEAVVSEKLIGTRPLRVVHLKQGQDTQACHLLFVASGERTRVPLLLARLKGAPILTVGDTEDFVKQGGIIGFFLEGKKVRFEINLDASQRAGLKISSRLLLLAKSVIGGRG